MPHRPLPSFDALVAAYPHRETPAEVKQKVGGAIDDTRAPRGPAQWLGGPDGDTCTIRMSRAFNYAGAVIPRTAPHLVTVAGGDGKRYGFRAREFDAWLRHAYGAPDIEVKGKPVLRDKFNLKKGLISFDIVFGADPITHQRATGHVDLWDGTTFYDEIAGLSRRDRDFFTIANSVSLWLTDGQAMLRSR